MSLFKSRPKVLLNYKQIASAIDVKDTKGRKNIIKSLNTLNSQDKIKSSKKGQYQFNAASLELFTTQLTIIPSGKGVVRIEGFDDELVVPRKFLNKGLHGDTVEISIQRKNKIAHAHVETILARANK